VLIFSVFTIFFRKSLKRVFQFANRKYEDYNIQNYNFACCFVWVRNLACHIRGERRLRAFENRVLRRIFGLVGTKEQGSGENYMTRSLTICTPHPILFG